MSPGPKVVTFSIILWSAGMVLHLQKLVSRDSAGRIEAAHIAKMVLRRFVILMSLHKVVFRKLHSKGKKYKKRFGNLLPTLAMEVRDHCLMGFEDVVAGIILVVIGILGNINQLHVVKNVGVGNCSLIGL